MNTSMLSLLSQLNSLLREVALNRPEYYERCLNMMRMLRSEVDKENEQLIKNYRLIKDQLGNERNN